MSRVIKCLCEECFYNNEHNCSADAIEIHSSGDLRVKSATGTMCKTFKPRNDDNKEKTGDMVDIYNSL
ncbi:DUF1540 domain-containing protein [Thermosyntropha sp.]|uniref:DUF1540 domain-containing protein n=1 Tax=Thermosyntropha sp. TaxID=2740820 RepID=UPI0025FB5D98|nr:DUF1540 domain-containing protein [Thermosyntropha sp.]MBO8158411.1 DUF1540 domain-containing protein [Thermosyntropha sp.]